MCRELEKWSMEERQEGLVEGQRKGEDNLAKLLKLLKADGRLRNLDLAIEDEEARKALYKEITSTKKFPRCYRNNGQHQGIFLYKAQQHFFARLLRLFIHFSARLFVFLLHFSARLFVKSYYQGEDAYKTSTSQTAFERPALLGREPFASLFRSPLWPIRLSWPGGSGRFPAILGRFCGPCSGLRDRC